MTCLYRIVTISAWRCSRCNYSNDANELLCKVCGLLYGNSRSSSGVGDLVNTEPGDCDAMLGFFCNGDFETPVTSTTGASSSTSLRHSAIDAQSPKVAPRLRPVHAHQIAGPSVGASQARTVQNSAPPVKPKKAHDPCGGKDQPKPIAPAKTPERQEKFSPQVQHTDNECYRKRLRPK